MSTCGAIVRATADACIDNDNDEHKSFELIVSSLNKGAKQDNVLMVIVLHVPVNLWSRLLIIQALAFSIHVDICMYLCS